MPYKVISGDILEQDADAIVVPHVPDETQLLGLTSRIYKAAGYQNMMFEFQLAKHDAEKSIDPDHYRRMQLKPPPLVAVTPGLNLKAKYAIHIFVPAISWRSYQSEREKTEDKLYRCYLEILRCALKIGAGSIVIPLFGMSLLGIPNEFSMGAAERAIGYWSDAHIPSFFKSPYSANYRNRELVIQQIIDNLLKIYIVIPETEPEKNFPAPINAGLDIRSFMEYEKILSQRIKGSGLDKEAFFRNTCYDYLKRIHNDSEMAETLGFGSEVIHRFRAKQSGVGKGNVPKKKQRVIALAIGMELDDYERFEFIRCSGFPYPDGDLDYQVEYIIRSGIRSFERVNDELCQINPEYDLTKPAKQNREDK